jgi:hypothetical protein
MQHKQRRKQQWRARLIVSGVLLAGTCSAITAQTAAQTTEASTWDKIGNIKDTAVHIGTMQRLRGADKVLGFIDACYRTHSLNSGYSKAFEGCIVADYLLAQALIVINSGIPPEKLRESGAASPRDIINSTQARIGSAFGRYGISPEDGKAFLALAGEHGIPLYLRTVSTQ